MTVRESGKIMGAVTEPPPRRFSENLHFVWVAAEGRNVALDQLSAAS